jgi:hypothetical protein
MITGCENDRGGEVDVAGFGMSSSTYPCEIIRTYQAIKATEGKGFIMGGVPRFFLRMRLVTKGIFSGIFGLLGLG